MHQRARDGRLTTMYLTSYRGIWADGRGSTGKAGGRWATTTGQWDGWEPAALSTKPAHGYSTGHSSILPLPMLTTTPDDGRRRWYLPFNPRNPSPLAAVDPAKSDERKEGISLGIILILNAGATNKMMDDASSESEVNKWQSHDHQGHETEQAGGMSRDISDFSSLANRSAAGLARDSFPLQARSPLWN